VHQVIEKILLEQLMIERSSAEKGMEVLDDVNLENFLDDSDEQDGYHTPPPKVNTTPTSRLQR
ncbi:482_t:CDS:2, partial [Racocetra fulgida]